MSARVHPGETNSSWIMKGILQFLTDPVVSLVFCPLNILISVLKVFLGVFSELFFGVFRTEPSALGHSTNWKISGWSMDRPPAPHRPLGLLRTWCIFFISVWFISELAGPCRDRTAQQVWIPPSAHAESRWRHQRKLPLQSGGLRLEQALYLYYTTLWCKRNMCLHYIILYCITYNHVMAWIQHNTT